MKLTLKQQRFADEYIISGNATQAAIKAGYSKRTANRMASENLAKPVIKAYIDERLAELNAKAIADQEEVLRLLTRHARRETTEYNVTKSGGVVKTPTAVNNAIKASELLGKRYGLFRDRVEADVDMDLNISIDYGPDG